MSAPLSASRVRIVLGAVLAIAAILRFRHLDLLPPAHYRDVALTASDALRAASGHPCLHYTYDEGLYANLMGLVFLVLGASDWTVRALGSLFGVLTCLGVYRLGKALDREGAGLYGAALLAASLWHVILSRSGFRAILLPLLMACSFAFLIEGVRAGRPGRCALSGVLFGLGVHVYPAVRFAPLILPPYLLSEPGLDRGAWRRRRSGLLLFLGAAFLVALPMLLDYLHHPEHFTLPRRVLSVFSPKFDRSLIVVELERNVAATLLMFHVHGDDNWRHNLAGAPMLDPLTGLLFLAGLVAVCRRPRDRPVTALLLSWLLAMLLPNVLSVEGVPHGLRSCGVLPAVALLGGIGMTAAERALARRAGARAAFAAVCGALLLLAAWTGHRYFDVWGKSPEMVAAHDGPFKAAALLLREAPPNAAVFVLANGTGLKSHGQPAEVWTYLFELRARPPVVIGPKDGQKLILLGRPALVAFVNRDDTILRSIQALNPGAPVREMAGPGLSPQSPVYRIN